MPTDRSNPGLKVLDHQRSGHGVQRVPYPIGIRLAVVLRKEWVTERMLRLTLGGPDLAGVHTYAADDHVKLIFPDTNGQLRLPIPNDHDMLDWPQPLPPTRTYTIRRFDPDAAELDLDFVIHQPGLASDWATSAPIGSAIAVAGPPGATVFPLDYQHYLFAVDSTALPAVARWLAETPHTADLKSIHVIASVEDPAQRSYPVAHPQLRLQWLKPENDLATAVAIAAQAFPDDSPVEDNDTIRPTGSDALEGTSRVFLFAAGEAELIKPLRRWARRAGIDHSITGYWKRGEADFDD